MGKAFSYLRFSTPQQLAGDSLRRQTQLANDYAAKNDLELDQKLTFKDLGLSGFHGDNEAGALGAFLEAVRSGVVAKGSVLLVESLDRISRKTARKAVRILESIVDLGVDVVTLSDNQRYSADRLDSDPMSFLMSFLIFVRAHEESQTKSRRVAAAWHNKRAHSNSKALTKQVPGWLNLAYPDKKPPHCFAVNRERVGIVRRIFRLTLQGTGQDTVARTLNVEGVPVFGRGKQWHKSFIRKMLGSPAVVGVLIPHMAERREGRRKRTPLDPINGYYPAILPRQIFDRVTELLKSKNPRRGRHANGEISNLFGGLARCPLCSSTMTILNKGQRSGRYLVCVRAKSGAGCKYTAVPYEKIEREFLGNAGQAIPKKFPAFTAKDLKAFEKVMNGVKQEIQNLTEQIARRPSAALTHKLATLEDGLPKMHEDYAALQRRGGPFADKKLAELREALADSPIDRTAVNVLLRELLESVEVEYREFTLKFAWRSGVETEFCYGPD